jgi:ubiquinone/menaquinone biosynthesis C-methylase UbiE
MKNFYEGSYNALFYSNSTASMATKLIHKALEFQIRKKKFPLVLEIGGGEGNHVQYVSHPYTQYTLTDIETRPLNPFAEALKSQNKLNFITQDAHNLTFANDSFHRVIFMCVLHHLENPAKALEEALRVVKPGGVVSIYLPCDPGIFYRATRLIFIGRKPRKLGLNFKLLNAEEHRNHIQSLEIITLDRFKNEKVQMMRFPFLIKSWNLNYFYILQVFKK